MCTGDVSLWGLERERTTGSTILIQGSDDLSTANRIIRSMSVRAQAMSLSLSPALFRSVALALTLSVSLSLSPSFSLPHFSALSLSLSHSLALCFRLCVVGGFPFSSALSFSFFVFVVDRVPVLGI